MDFLQASRQTWPVKICVLAKRNPFYFDTLYATNDLKTLNSFQSTLACINVCKDVTCSITVPGQGVVKLTDILSKSSSHIIASSPKTPFVVKIKDTYDYASVKDAIAVGKRTQKLLGKDKSGIIVPYIDMVPDMLTVMPKLHGVAYSCMALLEEGSAKSFVAFTINACSMLASKGLEARDYRPCNVGYVSEDNAKRWLLIDTAMIMPIDRKEDVFAPASYPINSGYLQQHSNPLTGLAATAWAAIASMAVVLDTECNSLNAHLLHTNKNYNSGQEHCTLHYGKNPAVAHTLQVCEQSCKQSMKFIAAAIRAHERRFDASQQPNINTAMKHAEEFWKDVKFSFEVATNSGLNFL